MSDSLVKEQLFQVTVNEVLDRGGALLDNLTQSSQDPAETFAFSSAGAVWLTRTAVVMGATTGPWPRWG
ncbi:hypothetical protein ACQP0C_27320 [Nocardia sp. CA-129566]|uniref:hypothetical protein n=1 Tax=Nocardia sp. CA-129566 TaxID=3239976 RepID=UPI003D961947